jgi:hypothetical protein
MRPATRRTISTLLPCAAIVLMALGWPASTLAQQTFSVDFPKKAGLPNSCMTEEPAGNGGTYLRCRIALPDNIPSHLFIRGVFFECRPGGSPACVNTQECPGNGAICGRHVYPVVPVDFNIASPGARTVEWWGWTSDTDEATLHFEVGVGP